MTGSRRRLAVLFCLAVLIVAAVLPGGGPLLAVLPDRPALSPSGSRIRAFERGGFALRERGVTPRPGRAPPTA